MAAAGGRRRPTKAVVPPARRRDIRQTAHTLRYEPMLLKLKKYYFYY
jgi:hypothetical protein